MSELVPFPQTRPAPETGAHATPRAHWFADLALTRTGLVVRKTGRKIGLAEITPGEFAKFLTYLGYVLIRSAYVRMMRPAKLSVHFAPDRPRPWYIVWSAMALGGVKYARNPKDADAAFYFEDLTIGAPPEGMSATALNAACTDISKSRVAEVWEQVSGYPLSLDPMRHSGEAVEKSEVNGVHDGRVVVCPHVPRPGFTYQAFIDASDGKTAFDLRTTIIDRKPLFVLVKTKPAANRFSIHNTTVKYTALERVFSDVEVDLLTRFAETMQLDWAALDVLRDRGTGRIYVVDVNKTDTGPAVDLSWSDRLKFSRCVSEAFTTMVRKSASDLRCGLHSGDPAD
jgi:hypothetical protein